MLRRNIFFRLESFQKSEVEGGEYQDDSYIHRQSFPEVIFEEQEIDSNDNGYQQQYIQCGSHGDSHVSLRFKPRL